MLCCLSSPLAKHWAHLRCSLNMVPVRRGQRHPHCGGRRVSSNLTLTTTNSVPFGKSNSQLYSLICKMGLGCRDMLDAEGMLISSSSRSLASQSPPGERLLVLGGGSVPCFLPSVRAPFPWLHNKVLLEQSSKFTLAFPARLVP